MITVAILPPELGDAIIEVADGSMPVLRSLRALLFTGGALDARTASWWRGATGPGLRMLNLYGRAETVSAVCIHEIGGNQAAGPVPAGRPLAQFEVVIARDGRTCAAGETGEIGVISESFAPGYCDWPGEEAASFAPDPANPDGSRRIFWTGDLGRTSADGVVTVTGRR
jgi:acyl-coenzyme A synthetase/AMP-(fatty) acid ligase